MKKHIVLQESASGRTHRIELPCVVGRSNKADLKLADPSISQRHALITETDQHVWIEDLNSSNGVFVNSLRIREKTPLRPGDAILLAQTELLLSIGESEVLGQTLVVHSLAPEPVWKVDHVRLKLIYEITTELSEKPDLPDLGERILSRLAEIFQPDRSYLGLFREDGTLEPILKDSCAKPPPLSKSIMSRLFQNGEAFLLEDALSEDSLKKKESIMALSVRSALCAPLIYHSQIHGLIYLDRNIPGAYNQKDLEFLRTIAFMLAPLIENARLWSELKNHYARTMDTLRETQARLIEMERKAAFVRLAQAMAHEIRNPLMAMGGMVRRIAQSGPESFSSAKFQSIIILVERIESILKTVDTFVTLSPPRLKLERIDHVIEEAIASHNWESLGEGHRPVLAVHTPHVMVPLDSDLFKKAISMIFREVLSSIPQGSSFEVGIQQAGDEVEISMGASAEAERFCEALDPALQSKPWSFGLFLNIAHKIISDHRGKVLLDPEGKAPFPVLIRVPRTIKA
jgi:hypothetical protein